MAAESEPWFLAITGVGLLTLGSGTFLLRQLRVPLRSPGEWFWLALVAAGALWAIHPFVAAGKIGGGDSYFYTLQGADFITQLRQGIFPVLVGQSEYAFNGAVHVIRTAPYFSHLAGLLDLLTGGHYSFSLIKNLTVVLSAWGAAFTAYATVRVLAPDRRGAALLVSFLYVCSPGLLFSLVTQDMYPTFMTGPWLPLFGLGVVRSLQCRDDSRPLLLSVFSLAAIWYAHPPIGMWLTPVLVGAQALRFALVGGAPGGFRRPLVGAALFAGLTAYLFYSVSSLQLDPDLGASPGSSGWILENLQISWRHAFQPFNARAEDLHLQLGWALWICGLACVFALRFSGLAGVFLAATITGLLILLLPIPFLTGHLWALVPKAVIDVNNAWPEQRFYPLLAGAITVWTALTLGRLPAGRRRLDTAVHVFLLAGCLWSASQLHRLHQYSARVTETPAQSLRTLQPENLVLTRSSYVMFERLPEYFSHGWTDPEFESRLLDPDLEHRTDNASAALEAKTRELAATHAVPLDPAATLTLDRSKDWLLVYDLPSTGEPGELVLSGAVDRSYPLPASGGKRAFGSGAEASHVSFLRAQPNASAQVTFHATLPGAGLRVVALEHDLLPVQVESQTPYRARVRSATPGFLETPRLFVPGYEAKVDGQPVEPQPSPDGLVAIPVPSGESRVSLDYRGPALLRLAWSLTVLGFLGLPGFLWLSPPFGASGTLDWASVRQHNLLAFIRRRTRRQLATVLGLVATSVALVLAWPALKTAFQPAKDFGPVRLTFTIPRWTGRRSEPLLTTGRAGAADCIYIIYDDPTHIRLGYDHWGTGGLVSEPIPSTRGRPHTVEITLGSLYPRTHPAYAGQARTWDDPAHAPFLVRYDGQVVWEQSSAFFPATSSEVAVGANPPGCSTCEAQFTGKILKYDRIMTGPRGGGLTDK